MTLAVLGGKPISRQPWPRWPTLSPASREYLAQVCNTRRWSISGPYRGRKTQQEMFAWEFATFTGAAHCTPCASGSAALSMTLQSLDVQPGDEVIVPALTWVATATAVLAAGAVPVVVDIDPDTLCLDPELAESAMTRRTRALMPVHYGCSIANLDALVAIAKAHHLHLIEDCAQAHGAKFRGTHVGTVGDAGAFSMQETKLLTCGEGGAVVTRHAHLAPKLEQCRLDGRIPKDASHGSQALALEEPGELPGRNRSLSEFQAAVLRGQLLELAEENRRRDRAVRWLTSELRSVPGVRLFTPPGYVTERTYYFLPIALELEAFSGCNLEALRLAISAELGISLGRFHPPLSQHRLFGASYWIPAYLARDAVRFHPAPRAKQLWSQYVVLPQHMLLADPPRLNEVVEAVEKVRSGSATLQVHQDQIGFAASHALGPPTFQQNKEEGR